MKPSIIYGYHPLREALRADKLSLDSIYIAKQLKEEGKRTKEILSLAYMKGIPVKRIEKRELSKMTGVLTHQGFAAKIEPFIYTELNEILAQSSPLTLLALDSIMDPQNLGAVIRSSHCMGMKGILLPTHRAAHITPTVIKASAGAVFHTLIAKVINLAHTLDIVKRKGLWIYGLSMDGTIPLFKTDLPDNLVLVVGGEEKGIRPVIRKRCDELLFIPMFGRIESLNLSAACSVAFYEIVRQRELKC